MQDRRRLARLLTLIATLVVALLLLIGTYAAIASQPPPAGPEEDLPVAASSASTWNSGWVTITAGDCETLNHNLAGDPDDYAVEMWFKDTDGDLGINRRYYGGAEENGDEYGAYWQTLTADTIEVCRGGQDGVADEIRIRVWEPPADPDADSGWMDISQGQTLAFPHNLNITNTELTVGLWFSGTDKGIHNYSYGGLADDVAQEMHGAHWHLLTNNAIRVTRHATDTNVEQVRVIVVHGNTPDYDSLEDGWQPIAAGTTFTFTHGLNWDPNSLLARAECYSSTLGIHQLLAGGNHDWFSGWQGANLQNLTENTVQVYRQPDDEICPQVRVRVWKRGTKVYLPAVFRNFAATVFPNDPYFEDGTQWGLHNTGQSGGTDDADIDAPEAWGMSTGDSSVIVAIADTGVDQDHDEFSGRLVTGRHFFNNGQENGNTDDDNGHGTHVAGIAAATADNDIGVAGVAWDVRIMPVKVLDSEGSGWMSDVASGVTYATDNGANVINLSLGSTSASSTLQNAVDYAHDHGALVVAAAGNCGDSNYAANGCDYQDQPNYPAAGSNTLAVASTTRWNSQSSFSNQGDYVDVAAPGSSIYSTLPGDDYDYKSGTSMATPFVSGLAGLILSKYPSYTPDQVAQAIVHNADDLGASGRDDVYGCGRINAYRSLASGAVSSGCSGWSGFSLESSRVSATLPADAQFRAGVLLVKFSDTASLAQREKALSDHALTILNTIEALEVHRVAVAEGQELAVAESLNADPAVAYAEPDYQVHALSLPPRPPVGLENVPIQ